MERMQKINPLIKPAPGTPLGRLTAYSVRLFGSLTTIIEAVVPSVWNRKKASKIIRVLANRIPYSVTVPYVGMKIAITPSWGVIEQEILAYGMFSKHLVDYFKKTIRSGQTVVDVGANIGAFTLLYSKYVGNTGTVHAFEPGTRAYSALLKNLEINQIQNVLPHHQGLSDVSGELFLNVDQHDVGKSHTRGNEGEKIDVLKFDDLDIAQKPVHFIKIDVEGHEYSVLKGMAQTLTKYEPVVVFEYSPMFYTQNSDAMNIFNTFPTSYSFYVMRRSGEIEYIHSIEEFIANQKKQCDIIAHPRTE